MIQDVHKELAIALSKSHDALKRELRIVPNIDGNGFVNLARSSSDLTKAEMSDLIELITEFGTRHSVRFGDMPAIESPRELEDQSA